MSSKKEMDEILAESFKALAVEIPIDKITIKEITDKAGVIRPTFYNHFQDKFELMEWIIKTELLLPIKPLLDAGMIKEAMTLLFTNIAKDKDYYSKAVKLEGVVSFHMIALSCVKKLMEEVLSDKMPAHHKEHAWLTPEIVGAYYAQSMVFACEEWMKADMMFSPQEMSDAYMYILTRSLKDVIS